MAITGGGNIYIFEDDRGFNYRGLWNSSTTYNAGDVVYYGSPQTAYLANATVTTTTPTTQNSGWSRLARRGTDGATGRAGDYTILLFARSVNEPRRPDSTDASYPADVGNFASTVWSRFEIPSGTAPVWMSWIRVVISTSSLEFGQVFRLSGEDGTGTKGDPGDSISAQYSPDGTTDWSATLRVTDKYVRFRIGTGSWSIANKFVGDDGASAQIQYSPDGSTDWVNTGRTTDEYIRFRVGTMPWSIAYKIHGEDGQSISFQFSPDNSVWHSGNPRSNDKYIRFQVGTNAPTAGIKFVGEDGTDGDHSLELRYSQGPTTPLHEDFQPGDKYISFRIGRTGPFGTRIKFVGDDGANAPNMIVQFASQPVAARFGAFVAGDQYIRFSSDGGTTWVPEANGVRFVGEAGQSVTGEGISFEFSQDGQAGWHATLAADDYFIRLQQGSRGWQTAVQFRAYPLQIQYSIDGSTLWHTTFVQGTDKYIRFSNDNGSTWTAGDRFVGEDGADQLMLQYSPDGLGWDGTLDSTDTRIRFSTDGGTTWSSGIRFVGQPGGFEATLYQRSPTQPTILPTTATYDYRTGLFTNLGSWAPNAPAGTTPQLWELRVFVPHQSTRRVSVGVRGSPFSNKGADGSDGDDGRWYRPVFQWSVNEPTDPSGLSYNVPNGTIDGLGQWREAPAQQGSGNERLWVAIIRIDGSTATYVLKFQYPSIAGPAGSQGDSIDVIYQRASNAPATPTGGTWNGSDYDPPSGWHESIPSGSNLVWMCIVTLSGTDRTNAGISYGSVVRISGNDGQDGTNADPVQFQYSDSGTGGWGTYADSSAYFRTSVNGGISWSNAVRFKGQDGTDGLNAPGVGTQIAEAKITWDQDLGVQTLRTTKRSNNFDPFTAGTRDIKGFTGGVTGLAVSDPGQRDGIIIAEAGAYSFVLQAAIQIRTTASRPAEIAFILKIDNSEDTNIAEYVQAAFTNSLTADQVITGNFTTPIVTVPASARVYFTISYRDPRTLSGIGTNLGLQYYLWKYPGADSRLVVRRYTNAAGTGGGAAGAAGSSIDIVYRRSSTALTIPPTGGTASDGELTAAPTDWSTSVPSGTDPVYTAIAHIDGSNNSITYDEPIRWQGEDGTDGTNANPVQFQYSDNTGGPWSATYSSSNVYFRTSANGGSTWSGAVRFRGVDGTTPSDGTDGTDGDSVTVIYQRATSLPGTPTGGTWNGSDYDPPSGWHESIPGGTNPIYMSAVHLSGTTKTNSGITYDSPVRLSGADGSDGAKGDSIVALWRTAATRPATPSGLAINSSGTWTDLTADNGDTWRTDPIEPSGGLNLYQQNFEVDWAGPTLTALGQPFQAFVRGADGIGRQGAGGQSITFFYQRTTASTAPAQPGITYNGTAFGNFGDWAPDNIPSGSGNHVWRVAVAYQLGVNGQRVTSVFEYTAVVYNYIPIFMRSTTVPGTAPAIGTWDGTTYTPSTGWSLSAPAATQTELVVMQWTRLTQTSPYTIQNVGVPQLSSLMLPAGMVTPPPPSRTSYTMNYGLVTGGPSYTISATQTTSAIELATGETGMFDFTTPATTQTSPDWYFDLPAGLTLVSIQQRQGGQYFLGTQDWTIDDSSQPRRYMNDDQYSGTFGIIRVNVRRA